jgi:hypothetical protein
MDYGQDTRMTRLLVIAEGHGDVESLRILVRRVLQEHLSIFDCDIDVQRRKDIRHQRANDWANFRRYLEVAYKEHCPVLWSVDCDDDCAWQIAKEVCSLVEALGARQPFAVALWVKEYESLFLSDFETTKVVMKLSESATAPTDPESIRGAKKVIDDYLPQNRAYKEPIDQPRITAHLDLDVLLTRSRCYRHLVAVLEWIVRQTAPSVYSVSR